MADNPMMENNKVTEFDKEHIVMKKVDVDLEAPADFTSPQALYEESVASIRGITHPMISP